MKKIISFVLILFIFGFNHAVNAQCSVIVSNDSSISCGNSVKLTAKTPWQLKNPGNVNYLNSVAFLNADTGFAVGYGGMIIKTVNGGDNWITQNSNTTAFLHSVFTINDSIAFASGGEWGQNSVLLKTTNGGNTWISKNTGTIHPIRSVFFIGSDTGYAVGGDDLNYSYFILKTTDGGNTWFNIQSGTSFSLSAVNFINSTTGYAVGNNGKILKTTNSGTSWNLLIINTTNTLTSVKFLNANTGFVLGNTTLYKTINGGLNWTSQIVGYSIGLSDICLVDANVAYLSTSNGIYKTIDGGINWIQEIFSTPNYLFSISNPDPKTFYTVGTNGTIAKLKLADTYTWSPSTFLSDSYSQNTISTPVNTTSYILTAVYQGGCIAKDTVNINVSPFVIATTAQHTTMCGNSVLLNVYYTNYSNAMPLSYHWKPSSGLNDSLSSSPKAAPLTDTKYYVTATTQNGCIANDSTEVTVNPLTIECGYDKTIICGQHIKLEAVSKWMPVSTTNVSSYALFFTSADTGFAVGYFIKKTTDGGKTWEDKYTAGSNLRAVFFCNANIGYAVGDDGIILKTTDAGNSWQMNWIYTTQLKSVYFTHIDTGYVVGNNGVVRKTVNGGISWTIQSSSTTANLTSVFFVSPSIGYVVGANGIIRKTINGGTSWTAQTSNTTNNLNSVFFTDKLKGFVAGNSAAFLKTVDGGNTWINSGNGVWEQKSVFFTDSLTGYISGAIGAVGGIAKTTDGGNNWSLQSYNNLTMITAIHFPNSSTGFVIGNGQTNCILKSPQSPDSFNWSNAGSLSNAHIYNPIASPNQTTTYYATANTNGCIAIDSLTVLVNPLMINAGSDVIFNPSLICGSDYQLDSITSNIDTVNLTYHWTPSAGLNDSTSINPLVSLLQTKTYKVFANTINGCFAGDSVKIIVSPITAEAGVYFIDNPNLICGSQYQLDSVISNSPESNLSYLWQPSTRLSDSTSSKPIAGIFQDIKYVVNITSPKGCKSSDSVYIKAYPFIADAGADKNINCGGQIQLDSVITNLGSASAFQYLWTPSNTLNLYNIPNPIVSKEGNYKLKVTNNAGCIAYDSVLVNLTAMNNPEICIVSVDTSNRNLIVWNKPQSSAIDTFFIYRETNVTGQFAKIASLPYSYQSIFSDLASQPHMQSNRYKISMKDSCGLETAFSNIHKTIHLTINQGMGNTWNLIWESYEGFIVNSYNIYRGVSKDSMFPIGSMSGVNNQFSDFNAPAGYVYYQIEVISPTACNPSKSFISTRSNIATNNTNAINQLQHIKTDVSIFPNPCNAVLNISLNNIFKSNAVINIYNALGSLVKTLPLINNETVLDIQTFANGLYFMEIRTDDFFIKKKFVVQH